MKGGNATKILLETLLLAAHKTVDRGALQRQRGREDLDKRKLRVRQGVGWYRLGGGRSGLRDWLVAARVRGATAPPVGKELAWGCHCSHHAVLESRLFPVDPGFLRNH